MGDRYLHTIVLCCAHELKAYLGVQLIEMAKLYAWRTLPKDSEYNRESFSLCLRVHFYELLGHLSISRSHRRTDIQIKSITMYTPCCACACRVKIIKKRAVLQILLISISTNSSYANLEPRCMTYDCGHTYLLIEFEHVCQLLFERNWYSFCLWILFKGDYFLGCSYSLKIIILLSSYGTCIIL